MRSNINSHITAQRRIHPPRAGLLFTLNLPRLSAKIAKSAASPSGTWLSGDHRLRPVCLLW